MTTFPRYSLTFDIDWAPDFVIYFCLDLLDKYDVKGTFFATHNTPANHEIEARGHTLGIHPNFLPNSTHGNSVIEIIEECLNYAPNAHCLRTHSLVQSSPLLHEVFKNFDQLHLDVSLLMHRSKHAHKCLWEFDGVKFERLLYNWEDDAEFAKQRYNTDQDLFFGEITVYDFHPIHIFLNSTDGSEYSQLKKIFKGRHLNEVRAEEFKQFINDGIGVQTYLKRILNSTGMSVDLNEI
jgi:hypothetical protein